MLTARRDPSFHPDALDRSRPTHEIDLMARHPAPSHSRFMTALQMIGSVLAIPLGLASGYSIYHSNFSTEAQCQSLRASIVSMLDKSADASTLRMLVRRDVATFETTCGSVDPEAVAAFKNLLASGTPAAPPRPVAPAKQVTREPVRPPQEAAKPAPAKAVEAKPVQRDAAVSDAKWVASVRDALIHAPEPQSDAAADTAEAPAAAPAAVPSTAPIRAPSAAQAPALSPAPPPAAPALPPAASIAAAPVPASPVDHPVPPAAIPDPAPMPAAAAEIQKPAPSGIRGAIAEIPLLGRLVK